ncbi:Response regulator MprA [Polystyrenella longa]|uniref:Response regulator MprA n=1 Tax=Polystyrenella longa TaxID=2528007 RepID=A0A518CRM4_9PLAN|nr:response regulator [Polystyrenella longa]QDU81881.1 Response regulator MprA [Polystyrenella longa]
MSGDEFRFTGTPGAVAHQILVVEDDQDTAASLKAALVAAGFSVSLAKDGGQAHSTFVMHKPDVVVLDLILPRESGFEVCERIKSLDQHTPVVILTAIELQESRVLADRVGADAYLNKPCDPEILIKTIRDVAEKCWSKKHLAQPTGDERIRFNCRCGKRFKVKAAHRGKSLTCPMCGEQLIVPR